MDAFYGEIRAFPFSFCPENWAYCNGNLLSFAQYQAIAAILGTRFGGDGKTTIGLPNLNGLIVAGVGAGPGLTTWAWGTTAGSEQVTIVSSMYPSHTHAVTAMSGASASRTASPNTAAPLSCLSLLNDGTTNQKTFDISPVAQGDLMPMAATSLSPSMGGGQAHENRQPVLPLSWCMCVSDAVWPQHP
ncbi:phage tail protein [Niveispirillum sp. SYP-B3756]|uniref:phage tail protein n=1 Tax=Niveispirillum sp. SYP-B3756 TaxID=2662178 RepID=UPI0012922EFC|nr:tail fiber protein [Niveispirillum sp. SYP-B3756]MQP68263.1 phage tail protein [Niveispirillum sp. SYP-B3756]